MYISFPGSWATAVSDECMSSRGGGRVIWCYISHISPVRLTFLLPSGIGAITELDEMNSKLGSLKEFSGRRVWQPISPLAERLLSGMDCGI